MTWREERSDGQRHKQLQQIQVGSFRFVGAALFKDGSCTTGIHMRIAWAGLERIWRSINIHFTTKCSLFRSHECDLNYDVEKKNKAFKTTGHSTSYMEHRTSEYVWNHVTSLVASQEPLLAIGIRRKLV